MHRADWITVVATALVLSCTSCTPTNDLPSSAPTTPEESSTPRSSTSATASVPPYLTKYTRAERAAFESALVDRQRFADRQAVIFERSKATARAKAFYRKYTSSWRSYWARLRQYDKQGIRVVGRSEVIRIRPAEITLGEKGSGSMTLDVCGDGSAVKVLQNGTPIPQPTRRPSIVEVAMVKLTGEGWWRVLYERAEAEPC